jgi:hypothetical protein
MFKSLLLKHWFGFLMALIISALLLYHGFKVRQYQNTVVKLQNEAALKDKTIEEAKGLYEHLTIQSSNVQGQLNSKDVQISELENQIAHGHEQLDSATSIALAWKQAYAGLAQAKQTQVKPPAGSPPSTVDRLRVDFSKTWDFIGASGYTLTSPPEAYLKIEQLRPLKLTLAVSRGKDGAWHSYVTSSESNVNADISVSVIDPNIRKEKWYSRLGIQGGLGVGTTSTGLGLLGGIGPTVDLGENNQFTVGPTLWVTVSNGVDKFYGANLIWRPFAK